jgi:hypothetical protein
MPRVCRRDAEPVDGPLVQAEEAAGAFDADEPAVQGEHQGDGVVGHLVHP